MWTKDARFRDGLPSSVVSSWILQEREKTQGQVRGRRASRGKDAQLVGLLGRATVLGQSKLGDLDLGLVPACVGTLVVRLLVGERLVVRLGLGLLGRVAGEDVPGQTVEGEEMVKRKRGWGRQARPTTEPDKRVGLTT